jgi:hypothetical protein
MTTTATDAVPVPPRPSDTVYSKPARPERPGDGVNAMPSAVKDTWSPLPARTLTITRESPSASLSFASRLAG